MSTYKLIITAIEDIEIFDIGMIYCKPALVHDDLILSFWL